MDAKRDSPGPDHFPEVKALSLIDGVVFLTSPSVNYGGDNLLTELYRPEWIGVFKKNEPIEHLYTVDAPTGGMRKEWYYHEHTLDRYIILSGRLDLGLYDGRKDSVTFGNFTVLALGAPGLGLPNAVRIPPLVWHSLKWQTAYGSFLNAKLPSYQKDLPDKFRIQPKDYPKEIKWNI